MDQSESAEIASASEGEEVKVSEDETAQLLEKFASSGVSKLGATSIDSVFTNKEEDEAGEEPTQAQAPPVRRRGRPPKKSTNNSKQAAAVYNLEEAAKESVVSIKDKWEQEKKDTVAKLSEKAARDLEREIKKAQSEKTTATKQGVEYGYAAKLSKEEMEVKEKLLKKINMYYSFYSELEESNTRKGKWSLGTPVKDLEDELQRCEKKLQLERAYGTMCTVDTLFNYFVEGVCIKGFGVPVHGLAAEAKNSREVVEDELKELSIKYCDYLETGPELRYLMKMAQRVNLVLSRNTAMMQRKAGPSEDYQSETQYKVNDKYSDL